MTPSPLSVKHVTSTLFYGIVLGLNEFSCSCFRTANYKDHGNLVFKVVLKFCKSCANYPSPSVKSSCQECIFCCEATGQRMYWALAFIVGPLDHIVMFRLAPIVCYTSLRSSLLGFPWPSLLPSTCELERTYGHLFILKHFANSFNLPPVTSVAVSQVIYFFDGQECHGFGI